MSPPAALIYSERYQGYNFGPQHPLQPVRLQLTVELAGAYGLLDGQRVAVVEPRLASDNELALVHQQRYIDAVKQLGQPGSTSGAAFEWGLGPGDNPIFPQMHQASALAAGGSLVAAELAMAAADSHAFHIGGGLHHAQRDRASGFCVYNDAAIAIAHLRRRYDARVLYLDFDAHHGDGVQNAFYHDPHVLTVSFHESGRYLFPGTGFSDESGAAEARGSSVNLPLAPCTGDDLYLQAYLRLVPQLAAAFRPDIIVTQNGCDSHWSDPLAHLTLTLGGLKELYHSLHALVHQFSAGRWLALGGGGYQVYKVVPRAWTLLLAAMAEVELDERLPEQWRRRCAQLAGGAAPRWLGRDRAPALDEAQRAAAEAGVQSGVAAIEQNIIPLLGAT